MQISTKACFLPAAIYFLLNFFLSCDYNRSTEYRLHYQIAEKTEKTIPRVKQVCHITGSVSLSVLNPNNVISRNRLGVEHEGSTSTGASVTANRSSSRNRYIKAAVTLAALVLVLNLCLLPYILYT